VRGTLWAAALLALLSGCILLLDPNVCTTDDQCPTGQICVSGDCQTGQAAPDGG
jgi:hypothetical protein